ncbi:MAG: hypothetical protein A3F09_03320 [Chlamydiae bacterium RIFCSPHIGHO2_12_FULL_49_11]|nr:MAG: hypothetical protein A3F09_03320 [Chlamydiae bacterium RIFCSPHIGHO2_12_FULL_49_11]
MKKIVVFSVILLCITGIVITAMVLLFRERAVRDAIVLYGNVDVREVDIGFRVAGRVRSLCFEEGDLVCEGQLMCSLDSDPYTGRLEEAVAAREAVFSELANAEILLKRRLELIPVGGVSQEDVDNAVTSVETGRANLRNADAAVCVARDNLSYTQAFAPTGGIVLTRIREPGSVVNPTDPVYTLSIMNPVWIRAFVDEPDLGKVHYGMTAEVKTDSGRRYTGKVGFISPVAEFTPKSVETVKLRTDLVYRLRIYVDNPDRGLVQGMPVTVQLRLGET